MERKRHKIRVNATKLERKRDSRVWSENETETHIYTAEGCRADTPAATTAAAAADLRVQFADSPKRCDADDCRTRGVGPTSDRWNRSSDPENARIHVKD